MATSYKAELAKINADQAARHVEVMAAIAGLQVSVKPVPAAGGAAGQAGGTTGGAGPGPTGPAPSQQPPSQPATPGPVPWTRTRPFVMPPIVRQPAELFASKLVLPFDAKFIRASKFNSNLLTYTPGVWPGYGDMGATGERDEIGLVTGAVAEWLCGGSSNNMLAYAQGHGSIPIHFRDKDGQIVSIVKEPKASCYYDPRAVGADPWYEVKGAVKPDTAHYPACSYVPYLASGDLFYLEELQYAATFHLLTQNPGYRLFDKGWFHEEQCRMWAWGIRDTASAYIATQEAEKAGPLPRHLLPSSYWKRILDFNRDEFNRRFVKGQAAHPESGEKLPLHGCHFAIRLWDDITMWQQDMLGIVLGWMAYTGRFPDWRENYEWHIRQAIDRTSGKSGWPRSRAVIYSLDKTKAKNCRNMAELAAAFGLTETPDGNFPASGPGSTVEYRAYLRMNLKIAMLNGISDAAECFAYADSQAPYIEPKWAV